MKTKYIDKILISVFVMAASSAFAQTPVKDALKAISDYQAKALNEVHKGTPDYEVAQKTIKSLAENAVRGVDPTKIEPKDAYDYARIYSILGKDEIVCDLAHKFVATEPAAPEKFDAEMLMMRSCNSLGEGAMLERTLRQTKAADATESSQISDYTLNVFADTIAKTEGYREAIKVIDLMEKQIIAPDQRPAALHGLPGYKRYLAKKNVGNPNYKMPSDEELISALIAMSQSGEVGTQFNFEIKKAELLADAGQTKEALKVVDDFGKLHADNAGLADRVSTIHNFYSLVGNQPPALAYDRKYGDFDSLERWKGKVVLIDTFAHWCGPCKASFPQVRKMYDDLHGDGLEIVGVTSYYGSYGKEQGLDPAAEFSRMDGFMKEHNMDWPVIFGDNSNFKSYGIQGIPTSILIGRDGRVVDVEVGYDLASFAKFRAKVEKALNSK